MIATLTLNPALDKTLFCPQLIADKKLRCHNMLIHAGGGGINVSKGLAALGMRSVAIFPAGGLNGEALIKNLRKDFIEPIVIPQARETREDLVVTEESSAAQYRFVMPGAELSIREIDIILDVIDKLPLLDYFVISGSMPPDFPLAVLDQIAGIVAYKHAKLIVDSSGPALQKLLMHPVYFCKPSLSELSSLVSNSGLLRAGEIEKAIRQIRQTLMIDIMMVSLGASGAYLATDDGIKKLSAPVVERKTSVGAGDSLVAGFIYMIAQGNTVVDAAKFGIACGSAATMNPGTELFHPEDALELYNTLES
jgi:6-phosphofructokinase 2